MIARRWLAVCLAPLLALTSCSGNDDARKGPSPGSDPAAIAAADSLFFTSQYTAAGDAYGDLIRRHPDDPAAHAAMALFQNYQQAPDRARKEAERAVALGPGDGHARAILCRVHDWANRIDDALTACHRAVELAPSDALAHIFLSEALADHAEIPAAREQIARARSLVTPAAGEYVRGELPREEANLAHDLGDAPGRLRALASARAEQPRWMNRSMELAAAYLDADDRPAAVAIIDSTAVAPPADPKALGELGNSAILAADYGAAKRVWSQLLARTPRDPRVIDVAGHLAVAADHDIDAAERLFQSSLAIDPTDAIAAGYLLAIGRDVRGDVPGARAQVEESARRSGRPGRPELDRVAADHATAALTVVNTARTKAGLAPVRLDPRLSQSATAHAYYWLFNNASPTVAKLGIHAETPGFVGYHGATPAARARGAGYVDSRVGEDITHEPDAESAVNDWVHSVYHRFPIIRPDLQVIGYGEASVGPLPMNDMEFGFGAPGSLPPVAFPADGQTDVPTTFPGNELPDPLPVGGPRVSGYPVTVTFPQPAAVRLTAFTISGPGGDPLEAHVLPPSPETENSAALLSREPLRRSARYTAHIRASVDGTRYDRTWSFTTK
ncbi:MAG: CAP domain-containing protein [Candidatus Dormibacteria bacterium]